MIKRIQELSAGFIVAGIFLAASAMVSGQELPYDKLEKQSLGHFRENRISEASKGFEILQEVFPKEPSYNYYLGRCYLVQEIHKEKTVQLLNYAAMFNYKTDAGYYLALACLKVSEPDNAEKALAGFMKGAKKRDIKKLRPDSLLASIKKAQEKTFTGKDYRALSEIGELPVLENNIPDSPGLLVVPQMQPEPVSRQTTFNRADITETNDQAIAEYDLLIARALEFQLACDSLQNEILAHKNSLRDEKNAEARQVLFSKISAQEKLRSEMQAEANQLFVKAEKLFRDSNEKPGLAEITTGKQFNEGYIDTLLSAIKTDSSKTIDTARKSLQFAIHQTSPYSHISPIPLNADLPDGLVYRIQLGVFAGDPPFSTFGGLSPLSAEKSENKRNTKYYVGYFFSSKEARKALEQVKEYGFADAFVVPYFNKSKISIQAAREIEFGNN